MFNSVKFPPNIAKLNFTNRTFHTIKNVFFSLKLNIKFQ